MNDGINLINSKKQQIERQEKLLKNFRRISFGSLVAVAILAVVLFLLNVFSPVSKLQGEQQTVAQNLLGSKSKIAKFLLLRDRLGNIDKVFIQNSSLDKILTTIASNIPGDVNVDSLGISKDNVALILTSPSLASINAFMDFLNKQVTLKTLFKKVTISSLTVDVKSGKYTLSVSAVPL